MSLTPEQKAFRASGMGGTDVAELALGSPLKVYAKKVDGLEVEDNLAMLIGRSMEPGLRAIYQAQTGALLYGPSMVQHPKHPVAIGSLDDSGQRDGEPRVIEYKTANAFVAGQWGEGADDVPERYLIQCQWYCGITGLDRADLAVLLGGSDFRVYTLNADPELFGMLLEQAERFWKDNVQAKRPPPVDGSDFSREWLDKRFKADRAGVLVPADDQSERWAMLYRFARERREAAENEEAEARNQLCAVIGDAGGMAGSGWRISWKRNKPSNKTDWETLAREALKRLPADDQLNLLKSHTAEKPGARVFRPTFKEK